MRDQRLVAYTAVVDGVSAMVRTSYDVIDQVDGSENAFSDSLEQFRHGVSLVNLVGSAAMRDQITGFTMAIPQVVDALAKSDLTALDAANNSLTSVGAFAILAGTELDQPSLAPRLLGEARGAPDPKA